MLLAEERRERTIIFLALPGATVTRRSEDDPARATALPFSAGAAAPQAASGGAEGSRIKHHSGGESPGHQARREQAKPTLTINASSVNRRLSVSYCARKRTTFPSLSYLLSAAHGDALKVRHRALGL